MTTVWKSQPKKFCELCKCWFSDNPNSLQIHERGKNHQDNVKMKICQIGKNNIMRDKQQKDYELCMLQIEKAAKKSHQKDIQEDSAEEETQEEESTLKREHPDDVTIESNKKIKKNKTNVNRNKIPKVSMHTPVIGKWTIVEKKKEENKEFIPIDLQLPVVKNNKTYNVPRNVSIEPDETNVKLTEAIEFKEKTINESQSIGESTKAANTIFKKKKFNKSLRVSQED